MTTTIGYHRRNPDNKTSFTADKDLRALVNAGIHVEKITTDNPGTPSQNTEIIRILNDPTIKTLIIPTTDALGKDKIFHAVTQELFRQAQKQIVTLSQLHQELPKNWRQQDTRILNRILQSNKSIRTAAVLLKHTMKSIKTQMQLIVLKYTGEFYSLETIEDAYRKLLSKEPRFHVWSEQKYDSPSAPKEKPRKPWGRREYSVTLKAIKAAGRNDYSINWDAIAQETATPPHIIKEKAKDLIPNGINITYWSRTEVRFALMGINTPDYDPQAILVNRKKLSRRQDNRRKDAPNGH